MPRHMKNMKKRKVSSSESSSTESESRTTVSKSSSSESRMKSNDHKKDRRRNSDPRRKEKKCKTSQSSSSSSESTKPKDKRCKRSSSSSSESTKPKDKRCKRSSSSRSNEKRCKRSRSSNSSSLSSASCKSQKFDNFYNYVKKRLLVDNDMMPSGTACTASIYCKNPQAIGLGGIIFFEQNEQMINVDHTPGSADIIVRKGGYFDIAVIVQTVEPAQFGIFINAQVIPSTVTGTNVGANQLVIRHHLLLQKDDVITIRNYLSSSGTIHLDVGSGGLTGSTDTQAAQVVLNRIAPYPNHELMQEVECERPKYRRLYGKLLKKLECEKTFTFNPNYAAYGSFYRVTQQTLPVDASIIFEQSQYVKNLGFVNGTTDITFTTSGIYWIVFTVGTTKSAQFSFFLNGSVYDSATCGIDSGATQMITRAVMAVNAGDKLSVRNHTSAIGTIVVSQDGGGLLAGVNAELIIVKESPPYKDLDRLVFDNHDKDKEIDINCKWEKLYHEFKEYLVYHGIASGVQAFCSLYDTAPQTVSLEQKVLFYENRYMKNISHRQGTSGIKIHMDGVYIITADLYMDMPSQFTLFVNNIADTSTTSGTDSGAGLCTLSQIIKLNKGDIVELVNHSSAQGDVTTIQNAGGNFITTNINFFICKLA